MLTVCAQITLLRGILFYASSFTGRPSVDSSDEMYRVHWGKLDVRQLLAVKWRAPARVPRGTSQTLPRDQSYDQQRGF